MDQAQKQIKILHITFNMGIGGTEQVIRQLVHQIPETEALSCVVCIDGSVGALGQLMQKDGIEVSALKRSPGFDRKLVRSIREMIRDGGFDIVHCHQYSPFIYGRLAAFGTNAKTVFTEHGRFHPDRYRIKASVINWVLAMATPSIVAISKATRTALARYEFMPAWRIQVIYNGIGSLVSDPETEAKTRKHLGIPVNAYLVGTVSRLDSVKNQKMMLRAFARFLKYCPNSYLLMVGDGPEREELERQAQSTGCSERVLFTGFIDQPSGYLAIMDTFLLSSYTEGTSMTLLEAMSLGIPAVATTVGGNPEIVIHGETGLLVQSDDDAEFAEAMARIYKDAELRETLARNSRVRFSERFSATVMAGHYLKIYRQILGGWD
ncbi:glycosyltransferase [Marinobacter caseinilyticus]|uniref:glycosyltransferase n=1 Tax=Marinobacter caseinilyticus TaxID=2692195 RepID=UPI00140D4F62|nr:glycosyltransferase [Marinobacter caseinilyticus]